MNFLLDQGQVLHELLDSLGMLGVAKKHPYRTTTHVEIT
jgi:hypothetical protein